MGKRCESKGYLWETLMLATSILNINIESINELPTGSMFLHISLEVRGFRGYEAFDIISIN